VSTGIKKEMCGTMRFSIISTILDSISSTVTIGATGFLGSRLFISHKEITREFLVGFFCVMVFITVTHFISRLDRL
jgi:hypothetical protein